jgi:Rps23 Pro-64 3,4-dihydroxylase Tpa1-like proline 4-hydroxylase
MPLPTDVRTANPEHLLMLITSVTLEPLQLANQSHNNATKIIKSNSDRLNAINAKHAQQETLLSTTNAKFQDQLAHASKSTTKLLTNV